MRRLIIFLNFMLVLSSLSARQCVDSQIRFFPEVGSEIGTSNLILIELYGNFNLFYDTIVSSVIYAVNESGEKKEVTIVDSRSGKHNLSQILISVSCNIQGSKERFWLQIENLPKVEYKNLTQRLEQALKASSWVLIEIAEDNVAPIIPGGIRYEYDSSLAFPGEYSVRGTLSFIENGVDYTYETSKESIPNMLLRVTNENGYYVYLPVRSGDFQWHQGYCSSYFPEVKLDRNNEFRVRLIDMSGNQLESQNKLILF